MEFVNFFKYYASIYIILIFQLNNSPVFQLSLTDSYNFSTSIRPFETFETQQTVPNIPNGQFQNNFQQLHSPTNFHQEVQQITPSWPNEDQSPQSLNPAWSSNDEEETLSRSSTKLVSVNVQCSFNSMKVFMKFDAAFDGVVYSKDHFHLPECRYVPFRSGQSEYQFQLTVNQCGVKFVNDGTSASPVLEDVIIVQNEEEIQEMWDTAQHLRCKAPEMTKTIINTAFHVELNDPVQVSYSESKLNAFMDIQLGRGPHASPVTGMVKIGATLTLVITVAASEHIDIQVKDCLAHDGDSKRGLNQTSTTKSTSEIRMSDANGCVLKPKLLSPWRKTIEKDENSGVKATAYSFLQAFKFPDKLEVHFECNIEICNKQCHGGCELQKSGHSVVKRSEDVLEEVRLQRSLKVVSNEDFKSIQNLTENGIGPELETKSSKGVCLTLMEFIITIVVIFVSFALIAFAIITAIVSLRKNLKQQIATAVFMDRFAVFESLSRYKNPQP